MKDEAISQDWQSACNFAKYSWLDRLLPIVLLSGLIPTPILRHISLETTVNQSLGLLTTHSMFEERGRESIIRHKRNIE